MQLRAPQQLGLRGSGLRNGVKPFSGARRAPVVSRRAAEEEAAPAAAEEEAPAAVVEEAGPAVVADAFTFNLTE